MGRKLTRAAENATALGGMRDPVTSVARIPRASPVGLSIDSCLHSLCGNDPSLYRPIDLLLGGHKTVGFSEKQIRRAQVSLLATLGGDPSPLRQSGLQPALFRSYARATGDPDAILADWLEVGAPLGVTAPIVQSGVFPRRSPPTESGKVAS